MTLNSDAHNTLASAPLSRRHSYRYQGSSFSCVRASDLERKKFAGIYIPFLFSWSFWYFVFILHVWWFEYHCSDRHIISLLTSVSITLSTSNWSSFWFKCNSSANKLSKKIIKTPFLTFSCHLLAYNTQGLLFQNLFELQLLIHFWKTQGWIKLLNIASCYNLKRTLFVSCITFFPFFVHLFVICISVALGGLNEAVETGLHITALE